MFFDLTDLWPSATNFEIQQHGRNCGASQQDYLRLGSCCFHQGSGQGYVSFARTPRRNRLVSAIQADLTLLE